MNSPLYLSLLLLLGLFPNATTTGALPLAERLHTEVESGISDACNLASPGVITWNPVVVGCPVCGAQNIFLEWGSFGNYIYQDPSKYQLIFWPHTDTPAWYSCKNCRFTTYMEDFKNPPTEKLVDLRKMLKDVKLPSQKTLSEKESMDHPPYLEIPTVERVLVAEKVYRTLGLTGDHFWNHFYRVMGYHLEHAKRQPEADEARRKSLAITERLLSDKTSQPRKELLYIAGAMNHFLRDDPGALKKFEEANSVAYGDKNLKSEEQKNAEAYLSELIKEYIEMIKKGKGPRVDSLSQE